MYYLTSDKGLKDPLPVHYLKDKVKSWGVSGDSVVMVPKDASFDELHVRRILLDWGFGEFKWQFTGFINVVRKEEMDEKSPELYRALKNLETDLKWVGLFTKKPLFEVSSDLRDLALHIKGLRPSGELAQMLNSNDGILKLVHKVRPDLLRIRLESIHLGDIEPSYTDEVRPLDLIKKYYENPRRVMWLIAVTRANFPSPWIGNLMKDSYNLLNTLCETVKRKTDEVKASIRSS